MQPASASNSAARASRLKWVIIGVVVLLVGVVAVVLWVRFSSESNSSRPNNQSEAVLLGDTYESSEHSFSLRFPAGWSEVPVSQANPYAVVKFQNSQLDTEGSTSGRAAIDVQVQPVNESLDDYARRIIEAGLNVSLQSKLLEHKDTAVQGQPARLISYEIPNKDGVKGRITHYIFVKNQHFYDLSFSALSSKWPAYQNTFDATVHSLELN